MMENIKMIWNPNMLCVHPQHMKRNNRQPVPITKEKFERKCSGKNKKEPKMCRWVQWYSHKLRLQDLKR